jgi:EAL domain-containing protein (putative c-di-GMP-specific phosphodiesterase class I)/CheY-like chemotaxis protein
MSPNNQTVLIIEADRLFADLLAEQMIQLGFSSIHYAKDGADAINRFEQNRLQFDIVLCGLKPSNEDGVLFLRYLIRRAFTGDLVVMQEAGGEFVWPNDAIESLDALPILGTLQKPTAQQALWKTLQNHADMLRKQPGLYSPLDITIEELEAGFENGEMSLHYQPQVDLLTETMVGVESLVRWEHPRLGSISPVRFIAEAEHCGLINTLTERVFAASIAQLALWRAEGLALDLSVNIAIQNLEMTTLPELLLGMAERFGIPAACITLELSENQLVKNPTSVVKTLQRLKAKGFGLAIEGFGSGVLDLEHLDGLPFTELKISRAFVDNARRKGDSMDRLKHTIAFAHRRGLQVVAGGVEADWHWQLARKLGCNKAQGYYIAKPMPPVQLAPSLRAWNETTRSIKSAYGEALCAPA